MTRYNIKYSTLKKLIKIGLTRDRIKNKNFSFLDFSFLDFENASFNNASFENASFKNASFENASFNNASFNASFNNASFENASFKNASFENASFNNASLNASFNASLQKISNKKIIGYKKCRDKNCNWFIVKLEIPAGVKRSRGTTNKCRAERAKVLKIYSLNRNIKTPDVVYSIHNKKTEYKIRQFTIADKFDENRFNECSGGIHFFEKITDAINY